MKNFIPGPVYAPIGMGAKIVALGLNKISGKLGRTVTVVKCQGGAQGWNGDPPFHRQGHNPPQRLLGFFGNGSKVVINKQVGETGIFVEGGFDFS
jgi:hypothetical protein